jgi:molybdopterin converting factor small subunit/photosystem II stability/assembly factor-like uncharacterized protein
MYVAISAGGVYRTEDRGQSWDARNRGIRVAFQPEKYPEFGQCVHKMVLHPARPDRLFLQNHWGLYRSDDGAESWQDIAGGVPSDFGFAMVMHPHDADCVYIVPVESDEFRCTPDGRLRVYRTRNAGASWEPLGRGLPQTGAYETVLRDAMAADTFDPAGLYFGTRSGQIYGSSDEGKTWKRDPDRTAARGLRQGCFGRRGAPRDRSTGSRSVETARRAEEATRHTGPLVSVTVHISPALRAFADGRERIEIGGTPATLAEAFEALWRLCPGLRDRVATEAGEIRQHVNVFVGRENVRYTGGWTTPLSAGDEISIFHAVSGG